MKLKNNKLKKTRFYINSILTTPEAISCRCSVKKGVVRNLQSSQDHTCARVSFLIKLQADACNFTRKRDSGTGVFLGIL